MEHFAAPDEEWRGGSVDHADPRRTRLHDAHDGQMALDADELRYERDY